MKQRGYTVAFGLVLLAVCFGAFFGGRWVYRQVLGGGGATSAPLPAVTTPVAQPAPVEPVAQVPTPAAQAVATSPGNGTATPKPLPTLHAILTPFVPPSPTFEPFPTELPPLPTSALPAPSATAVPTSAGSFEFVLAAPLRATDGDCAANLILGRVVDRNGTPLPGVLLHLTDEYGAENTIKTSKPEQVDLGRYDFPLSGPGRHYYLVIEDAAGRPISERLDIEHGIGLSPKASCHWADWKQR